MTDAAIKIITAILESDGKLLEAFINAARPFASLPVEESYQCVRYLDSPFYALNDVAITPRNVIKLRTILDTIDERIKKNG